MIASGHAAAGLYTGEFDESSIRARLEEARSSLPGGRADLALVFLSTEWMSQAREVLELVQVHGRAGLLIGCSGAGVIGGNREVEGEPGLSFVLLHLPGAHLTPYRFSAADVEEANGPGWWHAQTGVDAESSRGWLVFADPFGFDVEQWMRSWNEAYPGVPTLGGLAVGTPGANESAVFLNQAIHRDGGVALSVSGNLRLEAIVSQGCTPIGRPWTITAAERNLIQSIGNLPALNVLQETFDGLPAPVKARASGNIFVGLAVNEYLEEHRRGDFLIRNLLGADPARGIVAVGARVRVGQTLQFQFRDGAAATEDLSTLLDRATERLQGQPVRAACLCSCAGRGRGLFGTADHDAGLLQQRFAGLPTAGFFCNGEIGPLGLRNYVHGYTASVALFVTDVPSPS